MPKPRDIEQHPDAWQRFERAVDVVAKSPPQPRKGATAKSRKKPAGRKINAPKSS